MIYVKSLLAGLAALVVLLLAIGGAAFLAPVVMERLPGQPGVGVVMFHVWPIVTGVLLISAAVSVWTFRKASRSFYAGR